MTGAPAVAPPSVPMMVDNPSEWDPSLQEFAAHAGSPPPLTLELLTGTVGSAAPLLFAADAARSTELLRGTFTDAVIAQVQRNFGCLGGQHPVSGAIHLVGVPRVDGQPVLRVHVQMSVESPQGPGGVNSQFWDLSIGSQVTVGSPTCPTCGAPLSPGELICSHCHTDARRVVSVPLAVSRLELY
jgi:hypothetical protein